MSRTAGLLLALAACGAPNHIEQADFSARMADVLCARTRECLRGLYDASYFGDADCRATAERTLDGIVDDFASGIGDCAYDADRAAAAWSDIAEMSCQRFYEGGYVDAVSTVWNCDVYLPLGE
ncbi:MAG: hypothetical protein R3F59_26750 [Myxococcota bacterium]